MPQAREGGEHDEDGHELDGEDQQAHDDQAAEMRPEAREQVLELELPAALEGAAGHHEARDEDRRCRIWNAMPPMIGITCSTIAITTKISIAMIHMSGAGVKRRQPAAIQVQRLAHRQASRHHQP